MISNNNRKTILIIGILIALILLPQILFTPYLKAVLVQFVIFLLFAMSYNILVGDIGLISFGHAAFFGLGAYSGAIAVNSGFPWWIALLISGLICTVGGVGLGLLTLRLKTVYFAISTLAIAEILRIAAINFKSVTNGTRGLLVNPNINNSFFDFSTTLYYIGISIVILLFFILIKIKGSWLGRSFFAIRDSEDMASSIGINVYFTKNIALIISTFFAGLSGALYGFYYGIVVPETLGVTYTVTGLLIVLIGGRGNIYGPILGTVIFVIVSELLREVGSLRMVVFSLILLLVIVVLPKGIISLFDRKIVKQN